MTDIRNHPVPVPGSSFSKTPLPKATKQMSMDNWFGKSPGFNSSSPIVVESTKGKRKTPAKSTASTKKAPARTFTVRVPEKRPVAQAAGKAQKGKGKEKDDESDFAPEEVSSEDDIAETESVVISENEVEPKEEEDDDDDDDADLIPVVSKKASSKGKGKGKVKVESSGEVKAFVKHSSVSKPCGLSIKPREGDLPPISDLQLIFDDIVSRVPTVTDLFGSKGGRKLRVATMCSGTESPLLALGLIGRGLQSRKLGKLELEHIFSCEIEPYKQAYAPFVLSARISLPELTTMLLQLYRAKLQTSNLIQRHPRAG